MFIKEHEARYGTMQLIGCDDQAPTLRSNEIVEKKFYTPQTKPTRHDIKINLNDYECRCGRKCNSTEKKCWFCEAPIMVK